MAKQIIYSDETRKRIKKGVDAISEAVGTTLGPKGRNVALEKKWGAPSVVHDGVTIAKEIELKDPFENMGAQLVKEASLKTNDAAGDGTTTAMVLAQALVDSGLRNIVAGANPMIIKRGLDKATESVVQELRKQANPVQGKEEKVQVATISSADKDLGEIIASAFEEVGDNGVITVEEGRGLETTWEKKEGMVFDKGYASAYFITDQDRMESIINDPYILVTDQKITSLSDLLPMLESLVKVSKNLVIIADELEGEALATLVVNKLRGTFNVLAVKAPGFGDRRKALLEDLAVLTGATVVSEETGRKLESASLEDLGRAEQVKATKDETVIVGGKGTKANVQDRITQIKLQIDKTESEFDREKLQERLAKLSGGVAVINVGAATEIELKEKKYRVEDAVNATRAAIEEGIVPGGGIIFLKVREVIKKLNLSGDERVGADILYEALEKPLKMIVQNAGLDAGWVVREVESKGMNIGFDVMDMEFVDVVKKGIIDPVKVSRSALQNAVSVAGAIITTEAMVADIPEKESPSMPGMDPSAMGM
jgi:chaperonin GroEL